MIFTKELLKFSRMDFTLNWFKLVTIKQDIKFTNLIATNNKPILVEKQIELLT